MKGQIDFCSEIQVIVHIHSWWNYTLNTCSKCIYQGCSYGGRRRAGLPTTFPPGTIFCYFFVPGTMFHNRGSIIAQYTCCVILKMTLSGSESPPGHPRSLVLRFVGFTHSACHYYSQLLTTTQIGLATTLAFIILWLNATSGMLKENCSIGEF